MNNEWPYGPPGPEQQGGGYEYGDPNTPHPGGPPPPYPAPPPYPYPYPAYPYYVQPPPRGSAVSALVVSILTLMSCCNVFAIGGIVFSALSLSENIDHDRAARHAIYAWIFNGVGIGLLVLFFVFVLVMESSY